MLPRRARRYVALKVVKSASHYRETALDEVKLCQRVAVADPTHAGHMHVAELLDSFEHAGPHGVRTCAATSSRAAYENARRFVLTRLPLVLHRGRMTRRVHGV